MKRRRMIQSVLGVSAAAMPAPSFAQSRKTEPDGTDETPNLAVNSTESVAGGVVRFFDAESFSALRRLGEILVPAAKSGPGAVEAEAAEFLDFLIGQSPADRQTLYRKGVLRLSQQSRALYGKSFAEISPAQTEPILAPLREEWTYEGPSDPFARFLRAAKEDFLQATINSRQWAAASGRRRAAGGLGTYWLPIE